METQHFLRRAYKRKLPDDTQVDKIKPLITNLALMLNAYLKSIGRISNRSTAQELLTTGH